MRPLVKFGFVSAADPEVATNSIFPLIDPVESLFLAEGSLRTLSLLHPMGTLKDFHQKGSD